MQQDRDRALAALEPFRERALPAFARRLRYWKGAPRSERDEMMAELDQELALDCLTNTQEVLELDERARHQRWLRLAERYVYRQWSAPQRRRDEIDPEGPWGFDPPPRDDGGASRVSEALAEHAHHLVNGRFCLAATCAALGWSQQSARKARARAANELGLGLEYRAFWCRRLAEALTGLAADRLRDAERVWVRSERRRMRPDPDGRAHRLRRIRAMLARAPVDAVMRSALPRWTAPGAQWRAEPLDLLDDAAALRPDDPGIELWRFEAAAAEGRLGLAAQAIRRARALGADRGSAVLARARLLELRGLADAASALVARARRRWPRERRLEERPRPRQLAPYPPPPGVRTIH